MTQIQPDQLEADIIYSVNDGKKPINETRDVSEGDLARIFTGAIEARRVILQNGRLATDSHLDTNGFTLRPHPTKMRDFFDVAEIKSVYYPEIEALVSEESGAKRVVIFDHTVRTGDEAMREQQRLREPLFRAHNDYSDWSGPQRVRDILGDEAEALLKNRFAIIQVWRPIRAPIARHPLALCDARTIARADLIPSERRFPDRVGETYQVAYNPAHAWSYYPGQTRDEAVVFKVFDADPARARYVGHTGFDDPTTPTDAPPRESIEMRCFAFF